MSENPQFSNEKTRQLWADYLRRVAALKGLLSTRQSTDMLSETKAHLFEGFINSPADSESARMADAIEKLGAPECFVPQWVEERLSEDVESGGATPSLLSLLRANAANGLRQFALTLLAGFGYLMSFYFFIVAILKPLFPENVGLYLTEQGVPILGYVDAGEFTEVLGWWLVPLGIVFSLLLQAALNRWIQFRAMQSVRSSMQNVWR